MDRRARGAGTIAYDQGRGTWRVAVTLNGRRVHRRADTHAAALAQLHSLLALAEKDAYARLRAGTTMLDLSGLTDEQIATLLVVIQSWGVPDPLREDTEFAAEKGDQ